jgi:thiamine biosynthesis lipoprotein
MLKKSYAEKSFQALGTLNDIKIYGCRDGLVLDEAVSRVRQIEQRMSAFIEESDVSRINRNAGEKLVEIHPETASLIKKSITFSILTDGAFDITVRPLVELWGIGRKRNEIPSKDSIDTAKRLVDYRKILLDEKTSMAGLREKGQAIDLGGIAKGYAAEEVKRVLAENGATSALINLGGNILTIGKQPDGQPWQIGIQNPVLPTGKYLGILSAADKTIVTSGSNERFFITNGKRYHHILDPRTGEPSQSGLLSITAVCGASADADALTTSIFVLGPENGMKLVKMLRAEAVFVTENLEVLASKGLRNNFKFLN